MKSSDSISSTGAEVLTALAGGEHSLLLTAKGQVYSAGACGLGWCRNIPLLQGLFGWRAASFPAKIASIHASYYHNLGITDAGKVYSWGCGTFVDGNNDGSIPALGPQGKGDLGEQPVEVPLIAKSGVSLKAKQVTGGAYHSAVLAEDGQVVL